MNKSSRKKPSEVATRPLHVPVELHDRVRQIAARKKEFLKDAAVDLIEDGIEKFEAVHGTGAKS